MNRVILYCVLICFIFPFTALPQGHIIFDHLTIENGLSQSSVTCIIQDRQGFMWFGTQDGLNRYDGYNFKVFKNIPDDTTSLTENFIYSLYVDESGILFVETQSGLFHKYNPVTESFALIEKDISKLLSAEISTVGATLIESSGIIWSGGASRGTGLKRTELGSEQSVEFKYNPEDPFSLSDDKVYSIYRDRSGNLWIGTANGLDRFDESAGRFYHYRNESDNSNSLPDNYVWPIFEDNRGYLWIGTAKGGISCFDPQSKIFKNYSYNPNDPGSLNDNWILSIYQDRGGLIWIGTNTGGINYFNPATQVFRQYMHDPQNKNSIKDDNVLAMAVDPKGNYWVATRNGGLDKISPSRNLYKNYSTLPPYGLVSNLIQVICQDKDGMLWLGTFNSGLMFFDPETGKYKLYKHNPTNNNSISDDRVMAVIEDSEGIIWLGTYGGGLNKLDHRNDKVTVFKSDPDDSTSISLNSVWALLEDHNNNLWAGTFGGGVNVYDKKNKLFKHFKNDPNNLNSICDDFIIRIFEDSKKNIWFGTTKGLSKYVNATNSFVNYSEENGLANNFVFAILEDNSGNLWLSTNNGLSRFDPKTETFKNFYAQDGLQGNEFNQGAFAKNYKTGELLFGGPNGFNVFDPSKIKQNTYVPPISFTEYLRYNTDDEEGKPIIEKGISARDSIILTYKDNITTLQFAALSYYNNSENQYKYMLEGFNENWIQLGNNHTVTFTNLSPGDYTLRVIGSNNDGLWNNNGASLFVEVLPPWWRTNIAYTIYVIAFLSAMFGLRTFEMKQREQKAKMRENELRLKATEAEKRAIEIENERKTKELEEARELQLSMLPRELPKLPNLEIAAFMKTATEVGGDYYDFIVQENGTLNVAFGDATGHGLQAGTMVTLMKGFFTSDAAKLELQEFMNHCTGMIKEIKLGRILMSFSLLKFINGKLLITSAGMPPVYYFNKEKQDVEEITIQGMPLGAMRKFSYKVVEKEIKSGDTLLLLSDGLPEQMNSNEEMFGYPRVKDRFNDFINDTPENIIQNLVKSGEEWMGEASQQDDISFVVIKVK